MEDAIAEVCNLGVMFNPNLYGEEIAHILGLDGGGQRLMPLTRGPCSSAPALQLLPQMTAATAFGGARAPQAAMAGLYLYFSCWEEAHTIAQGIGTAEGSYWHAIVHRQEPDAGNAAYWFRRVGKHPIFPALRERAAAAGVHVGPCWDPIAFVEFCEHASSHPGSESEKRALAVQLAEWQLLFDFCAGRLPGS